MATDLTVPYGLPSTVTAETGVILRPKKRKLDSSELQPWHLEVQGSQRIVNIRYLTVSLFIVYLRPCVCVAVVNVRNMLFAEWQNKTGPKTQTG